MRQLNIYVRKGQGKSVIKLAKAHNVMQVVQWDVSGEEGPLDMISLQITNRSLGGLLADLEQFSGLKVSFFPHEVIAFVPPPDNTPQHVVNLQPRSPIEIFLHSLQSVDQWGTFLILAISAAIVVWIAFYTNSIFLLLAAMLIAPFAEPAMNVAVSTATGDKTLFFRNLKRYGTAIIITSSVTAVLAFLLKEKFMTELMVSISRVNGIAFLLPLVAGVAGALNVVQSQRTSLVTGSAAGVLIAASLAPPAGLIGMALSMENWNTALSAVFLLVLQLAGINLSGSLVLRMYGLSSSLERYNPGKKWVFYVSVAGTVMILAGLLTWQFSDPLRFQRASLEARMDQQIREVIDQSQLAKVVEMDVRFPEADPRGSRTLLITGYVRRAAEVTGPVESITEYLQREITKRVWEENPQIKPFVELTLVESLQNELGLGQNSDK